MATFTNITVIYNPNSTGNGKDLAKQLIADLSKHKSLPEVTLLPTKYAGHAEELAYKLAKATKRPLVISASGDGGYHEVVNGLMRAQLDGATPTAGLLPAGNANDHYHDIHTTDVINLIKAGKTVGVDMLQLKTTVDGKPFTAYAHSYIGFGLTPKVGQELNKFKLNWFNEIFIVLRALFFLQPVKLIVDGRKRAYDSLIFSNVKKMSKVLSLSHIAKYDDGIFEVTAFKRRHKLKLVMSLVHASTKGLRGTHQETTYTVRTRREALVQLDGEILTVDADSNATITIAKQQLRCII